MAETAPPRRSGRAAEAARNDQRILESARAVFLADPGAPITAVAKHADVGISAIYSRYGSKEELLRTLSRDGLVRFHQEIEAAVRDDRDPWTVFSDFMHRLRHASLAALTLALAGKFTPTDEMFDLAALTDSELSEKLFPRVKEALRPGVEVGDVSLVLEMVGTVKVSDPARTEQLQRRYLEALLDGLRAGPTEPLTGPAPSREEINERWDTRS